MASLDFKSEAESQTFAELLQQWHADLCEKQLKALETQLEGHRAALLQSFDQRLSLLERRLAGPLPGSGCEMDAGKSDSFVECLDSHPQSVNASPSAARQRSDSFVECLDSHPQSPGPRVNASPRAARPHKQNSFIKTLQTTSDISVGRPQNCYQWGKRKWRAWHGAFDLAMGVIVLYNVALIFVQLQAPGINHAYINISEHILNALYVAEIVLRIAFEGSEFLTALNLVDALIVVITCLDFYLLSHLFGNATGIIRLLKILRIVKTFKMIRTMSLFRHLRVLLRTIAYSFMTLLWSMMVLGLCQLTGGLLICHVLQPWASDPANDPEMRAWVSRMYGTSSKAIYTFFEITFSGGWPNYARPLIEQVHPGFAVFFIVYITFVNFSIIRIISAMFLKETLHSAESDADMRIQQTQAEGREFMARLRDLFCEADVNLDLKITFDEFDRLISFPKVLAWFHSIGVDVTEGRAIFDLLDVRGAGEITFDEFAQGIVKQKGVARSQDFAKFARSNDRLLAVAQDTRRLCRLLAAAREPPGLLELGQGVAV